MEDDFDLDAALEDAVTGTEIQKLQIRALWKIGIALESVAFALSHLQDETGEVNVRASVTVENDEKRGDWRISGAE